VLGSTIEYFDTIDISNPIALQADVTLHISSGSATQSGVIGETGGSFAVTKTGAGSLTFNTAHAYTGATNIDAGALVLANSNALQQTLVSINVDDGLDVITHAVNATVGGLAGSGNLNVGGQILLAGSSGVPTTYNGALTGSAGGTLRKIGGSVLNLGGSGSGIDFQVTQGSLSVNGGNYTIGTASVPNNTSLIVENNATLEVTTSDFSVIGSVVAQSGGTLMSTGNNFSTAGAATDITIQSGAQLQANRVSLAPTPGASSTLLVTSGASASKQQVILGGSIFAGGGGNATMTVSDGAHVSVAGQTWLRKTSAILTIDGGTYSTDTLTSDASISPTISITDPAAQAALTVGANGGSSTFGGIIQDAGGGPGSMLKTGTGTLTLTAANTFSGGTTIDGGTLGLAHSSAAGTGPITVLGSTIEYADTVNIANPVDLHNDATLNIDAGSATQSGAIGEIGGSFGLTKAGAGRFVLNGVNTYSGGTTIAGGILVMNSNEAFGDISGPVALLDGARLTTGVILTTPRALSLTGTGQVNVSNSSAILTWEGAVSGAGLLNKIGDGTLILTSDNTYSGGTSINGGTLLANNTTGSTTGTGGVTIHGGFGGTLGGTGSVAGMTTVNAGATVSPGASAGALTLADVSFNPGSTLAIELGGMTAGTDHDQLVVNSGATLGGTLSLNYISAFTATPGQTFIIVDAGTLDGTFDAVSFPDAQSWFIDYDNSAGTVTVGPCNDSDGDGVCDSADICPGGDDNVDSDGDGVPDFCDCPGDVDGDNDVDITDLGVLLSNFGQSGPGIGGDLNGDDNVDVTDLGILLANFGVSCP
jgi:autotransporter-associated beta strand protein